MVRALLTGAARRPREKALTCSTHVHLSLSNPIQLSGKENIHNLVKSVYSRKLPLIGMKMAS